MWNSLVRPASIVTGLLLILGVAGCSSPSNPLQDKQETGPATAGGPLLVGSANFPESETLAEIYAGALNAGGVPAQAKPQIGSREVYVRAVQDSSIDLVPDYSGNLLRYVDKSATATSAADVMKELPGKLPAGLAVLEPAAAEDKDSIVVTEQAAAKYGLKTLEDLGKVCDRIAVGMPPEAQGRPQGLPGLRANYGCVPKEFVPFSDGGGPVTLRALLDDRIQAADIFSTSPLIAGNNLIALEDPKNNFAAQQVLPLFRSDRVDSKAKDILNNVSRVLTTEDLVQLNDKVSGDAKQSPRDAAAAWLKEKNLGSS
ncbi:ABC transporter substrate-binding protein [Arthrobacter liuii]|uniref:Amino acid ABC transporter, substrate binding protein n=1 Tax=Arthrobacter liuii TaxID=1476996 RepID=A0ABQ2AXI7_9MICC|nr:ABC transporter substrate-binding protein [Arthrobacter liuii]GGI01150.1 putative amino acid ABC transporter, substrate binding protein [Arthrobacter liuii]